MQPSSYPINTIFRWTGGSHEGVLQVALEPAAPVHMAMPVKDSLMAATALTHDLTVVTHNRSDFEQAGVRIIDPFVR